MENAALTAASDRPKAPAGYSVRNTGKISLSVIGLLVSGRPNSAFVQQGRLTSRVDVA